MVKVKKRLITRSPMCGLLVEPETPLLEHKYGRNQLRMSKIGQNSMKKMVIFCYGPETSFLLIFNVRDYLMFHENRMLGSARTKLSPPTLTS